MLANCWKFVDLNVIEILERHYEILTREMLGLILERDSLHAKESLLFDYVSYKLPKCYNFLYAFQLAKWAFFQCMFDGDQNPPTQEQVLRKMDNIVYSIRFPLMPWVEFVKIGIIQLIHKILKFCNFSRFGNSQQFYDHRGYEMPYRHGGSICSVTLFGETPGISNSQIYAETSQQKIHPSSLICDFHCGFFFFHLIPSLDLRKDLKICCSILNLY